MRPAERLTALAEGRNPALIARLPSGFAVMGDFQFLSGYCLLLAEPMVGQLNDLEGEARARFLDDMARLGDAVRTATGCKRLNYSIYGNLDPFLHAHVWPRYADEDPAYATMPPLSIPASVREAPVHAYDPERHRDLQDRIRAALGALR